MLTREKSALTSLGKEPFFNDCLRKLNLGILLTEEEKTFLLTCSILFLKHYSLDKRYTSYADLAYYIVLKYSIETGDYKPLYDYSISFGFYPISQEILKLNLIDESSYVYGIDQYKLQRFLEKDRYTNTLEQLSETKSFIQDEAKEKSFIAPTSFGKSSVIVDYIKEKANQSTKILIVVPTKSLLAQTYRMVKESNLSKKLIIHDEMYNNEKSFIAILTQERALRLMSKKAIDYDLLFIDEAHNILKNDDRSILLSRLLTRNLDKNENQEVIYLSPLVQDENHLRVSSFQSISSHKILFNVKEPEIFELRLDGSLYKYNRFVNQFYSIDKERYNEFTYMISHSKKKNFLYNYRPIKIEELAKKITKSLDVIDGNDKIDLLIQTLKKEVHREFYAVNYLKHGLIYLHGKIPDLIKEYLESKYREIEELNYIIANSVILEGMNLPIDNLFIMNTRSLKGKELTNLIGRVNRLNLVFNGEKNNLIGLLPTVHFINTEEFNREGSKMQNQIEKLRSRVFNDLVENPTLESFDFEKLKIKKKDRERKLNQVSEIQLNESFINSNPTSRFDKIKVYLIESGVNQFYNESETLINRLIDLKDVLLSEDWIIKSMMEKINAIFIKEIPSIRDNEISRLGNIHAQNYYENYILVNQKRSLNENIVSQLEFFKKKSASDNPYMYLGSSYGEIPYPYDSDTTSYEKLYVDLRTKNETELVNLAIVKLKMEDDFISFKLNKLIVFLYDFDLISQDDYHKYVYGTTDEKKIELNKYGLNIGLISRLQKDNQIKNLYFDEFNNLTANSNFKIYLNSLNDFHRFEIERFID